MDRQRYIELLKAALRQGGAVLIKHFGKTGTVRIKENISSVVTEADLATEKVILEILDRAPAPCNLLTEESGYTDRGSEFTWVVDPLDGTSNFAAGLPWFGIIITLFQGTEPLLGGMYLPLDNDLYYAEKGKGSWKNIEPLRRIDRGPLQDQLIAYSFDYNDDFGRTMAEMQVLARLASSVRNIRSTNSLYDFCCAVDGRLGAVINQATRIWDIAAPWLLFREAGGRVTDIRGKEIVFDLSTGAMDRNYTILASGPGIHEKLAGIIQQKDTAS